MILKVLKRLPQMTLKATPETLQEESTVPVLLLHVLFSEIFQSQMHALPAWTV